MNIAFLGGPHPTPFKGVVPTGTPDSQRSHHEWFDGEQWHCPSVETLFSLGAVGGGL